MKFHQSLTLTASQELVPMRIKKLIFIVLGLLLGLNSDAAVADSPQSRAGYASKVAWWARPSESSAFAAYRVGGGQLAGGSGPSGDQGTWGWDYRGGLFPRRTILNWSNGPRYQGGTGAYRTDGPHVPDLPALLNPSLKGHRMEK